MPAVIEGLFYHWRVKEVRHCKIDYIRFCLFEHFGIVAKILRNPEPAAEGFSPVNILIAAGNCPDAAVKYETYCCKSRYVSATDDCNTHFILHLTPRKPMKDPPL